MLLASQESYNQERKRQSKITVETNLIQRIGDKLDTEDTRRYVSRQQGGFCKKCDILSSDLKGTR